MTTFRLARPESPTSVVSRRISKLALGTLALLLAAAIASAAPAGAVVSSGFGVQQRKAPTVEVHPLQYHGGPVLHSSDAYVIYWDPIGGYRGDWERLIDKYFQDVGNASGRPGDVFAVNGQYNDAKGPAANQSTFRGSYTDSNPYPTSAEGGNCTEPAVFVCLTDRQIKAEIQRVITSVAPPLPGATGTPVYYLLTPPGVNVCTDTGSSNTCSNSTKLEEEVEEIGKNPGAAPAKAGICGYHAVLNGESANPIPYVVQPWVAGSAGLFITGGSPLKTSRATPDVLACQDNKLLQEPNQLSGLNPFGNYAEGLADVIIGNLSVEQNNVVVNPFFNGWYQTKTSAEQADMCQFAFGIPPETEPTPNELTHAASLSDESINSSHYYIPWAFDSVALTAGRGYACWSGVTVEPYFTAPNPVNVGDIVGLNSESDVTLVSNTKGLPADEPYLPTIYTWDFGDSTGASGPTDSTEYHSYQYGGVYKVTLTIKDSGGNVASTTQEITVVGPTPPTPAVPGVSTPTPTPASTPGGSAGTGSAPKPLATAAIVSKSLKAVAKKGLVVRYSVNEQVAGRFEVLIPSSVAKRLGISGPPATGLPAGSVPEIVVSKAILITTKGGRSTVTIQFSKTTSGRLRRTRKLTVTLRLIVRNAASHSPASTTVVTAATLSH